MFYKIMHNKWAGYLLIIILVAVLSSFWFDQSMFEGFSAGSLANPGQVPASEELPLLGDSYPYTGKKYVGDKGYSDMWWQYPTFEVGSYAQITNNIRYPKNPDDGQCRRAEFCDVLYENNQQQSNVSVPLPPAPLVGPDSVRINYYTTDSNLIPGQPLGPELQVF
jgi:hypothetical protein